MRFPFSDGRPILAGEFPMKRLHFFVLLSAAALSLHAQDPVAAPPSAPAFKTVVEKIDLKDGDTLVFLGDSITHQCLYTQYVENYFYTRYPQLRLHFHNAGVGGDRAADALRRFEEDVAVYKPKYVTVLLGMNDGTYRDYDKTVFETYQRDMTTVLEKIEAAGATAVPMSPSMFDARAKRLGKSMDEPRNTYYNGVLALYGAWLREQAEVRGLGFVDMWTPLNNLTLRQRKKDPVFTVIKDGVHPGPAGQVIMAASVIEDMAAKVPVSQITIADKEGKKAATARRGKVTDLQANDQGLSFTFAAQSLPWVLPADAAEGVKLANLGHRLGLEKLTIRNLPPGTYELKIEGTAIGSYTDTQLGIGVELQSNEKTPQYQQSLQVATLNKQRNDQAYRPLRDQYGALKGKRRDLAKAEQAQDPELEAKKAAFEGWYATQKTTVAQLLTKAKELEEQIYQVNQPKPQKYELTRVGDAAPLAAAGR
jgi:lysophospholipase L1-like esterase